MPNKANQVKKLRKAKGTPLDPKLRMVAGIKEGEVRKITSERPINPNSQSTIEILKRYHCHGWQVSRIAQSTLGQSELIRGIDKDNRQAMVSNPRYDAWLRHCQRVIDEVPYRPAYKLSDYVPPNCTTLRSPFAFNPYENDDPCE